MSSRLFLTEIVGVAVTGSAKQTPEPLTLVQVGIRIGGATEWKGKVDQFGDFIVTNFAFQQ